VKTKETAATCEKVMEARYCGKISVYKIGASKMYAQTGKIKMRSPFLT